MLITASKYQFLYLIQMHGQNIVIYGVGIMPAKYYARYPGLGRRYKTGICTIATSVIGAFQ